MNMFFSFVHDPRLAMILLDSNFGAIIRIQFLLEAANHIKHYQVSRKGPLTIQQIFAPVQQDSVFSAGCAFLSELRDYADSIGCNTRTIKRPND